MDRSMPAYAPNLLSYRKSVSVHDSTFSGKNIETEFWYLGMKREVSVWAAAPDVDQKVVETLKASGTAAIRWVP